MSTSKFRTYVMPGLVFQGVLIGGGYGTGREILAGGSRLVYNRSTAADI
jgi:hypothetical protein